MALSIDEKSKIDAMDLGNGGSLSDFFTKKVAAGGNTKFLFIGLGGQGSKTVADIKKEIYKKILSPEGKTHPDNIEYLAIDTDRDTLEYLSHEKRGSAGLTCEPQDMEMCHLYDRASIMALGHMLPDYITSWLNPDAHIGSTENGACGIRQAGRYALFGSFEKVENILQDKLSKLHESITSPQQKLTVYLFAGLGGGTGSSLIIDIPYIIRAICYMRAYDVKIFSYLFLPDTLGWYVSNRHLYLKSNAYAALKEIDTFMNTKYLGECARFKVRYSASFMVDSDENIFDGCILISGRNEYCTPQNMVTDNIINNITADTSNNHGYYFAVRTYWDNALQNIANRIRLSPYLPRNTYYHYSVMNSATMGLPLEQLVAYIAQGTFEMLQKGWDKHATQDDVKDILNQIHMRPEEQADAIIGRSNVSLMEYHKGIGGKLNKRDVINGVLDNNIKATWMAYNVDLYTAWNEAKSQYLEYVIGSLNDDYRRKFKDKNCGIYFLKELISCRIVDGAGFSGILERLENDYLASIWRLIGGQEEIQRQADERMREIKVELESPLCLGPLENNKIEEYRSLCVQKLVADNMIDLYNKIVRDCLNQIIKWFETRLEEVQKYIDIFAYMTEVVNRNYDMVIKDTLPTINNPLLDFSLRGSDDATDRVINYMDNELKTKTPEELASALEDMILKNEVEFVDNPVNVFIKYLGVQFNFLDNLTLDNFMNLKYYSDTAYQEINKYCQKLKQKVEIAAGENGIAKLDCIGKSSFVFVSNMSQQMRKEISHFGQYAYVVDNNADTNSIYWCDLYNGIPLYALHCMEEYESVYENNKLPGTHLNESKEKGWKDFPQYSWKYFIKNSTNDCFKNDRELIFKEKVRNDTKLFIEKGLIKKNDYSNLYEAICIDEDDKKVGEDDLIAWCKEKDIHGLDKLSEEFYNDFCMKTYIQLVNMPTVFMDADDSNIHEILRMNIFLYRNLCKVYDLYRQCEEYVLKRN
jgi:hypothetical protein